MTRASRNHLLALWRRVQWLGTRIDRNGEADGGTSFDRAERGALRWAIESLTTRQERIALDIDFTGNAPDESNATEATEERRSS